MDRSVDAVQSRREVHLEKSVSISQCQNLMRDCVKSELIRSRGRLASRTGMHELYFDCAHPTGRRKELKAKVFCLFTSKKLNTLTLQNSLKNGDIFLSYCSIDRPSCPSMVDVSIIYGTVFFLINHNALDGACSNPSIHSIQSSH